MADELSKIVETILEKRVEIDRKIADLEHEALQAFSQYSKVLRTSYTEARGKRYCRIEDVAKTEVIEIAYGEGSDLTQYYCLHIPKTPQGKSSGSIKLYSDQFKQEYYAALKSLTEGMKKRIISEKDRIEAIAKTYA